MKYLIIGNQTTMASGHKSQVDFLASTKKWVDKKMADGTLEAAYSFPAGGAFFILNADSHEDLMKTLIDFPLRPLSEFEIHAAVNFDVATQMAIDAMKGFE